MWKCNNEEVVVVCQVKGFSLKPSHISGFSFSHPGRTFGVKAWRGWTFGMKAGWDGKKRKEVSSSSVLCVELMSATDPSVFWKRISQSFSFFCSIFRCYNIFFENIFWCHVRGSWFSMMTEKCGLMFHMKFIGNFSSLWH